MYSFDCEDAAALAGFWSHVTGLAVDEGASREFATLGDGSRDTVTWMFHRAEDRSTGRNRVILDLGGGEAYLDEARRLEAVGATWIADHVDEEWGARWVELHDPEGNLFRIFGPRGA